MAARELYRIEHDHTTQEAGSRAMLRWLDAEPRSLLDMAMKLDELRDAPRSERNNYWVGQTNELYSAMCRVEDEMLNSEVA